MEKLIATTRSLLLLTRRTLIDVVEALGIRNLDDEPGLVFVKGHRRDGVGSGWLHYC